MSKQHGKTQRGNRGFGKRDTHFLCLPLVTPESIPQLATSLAHFRNVTTPPFATAQHTASDSDDESVAQSSPVKDNDSMLRIIPNVAHRPPGTFHLTLGVMDLSSEDAMQRALRLLRDINYHQILSAISGGATSEIASRHALKQKPPILSSSPSEMASAAAVEEISVPMKQSDDDDHHHQQSLNARSEIHYSESQLQQHASQEPAPATASPTNRTPVQPMTIKLGGLSIFPNVKSARVFYAKPLDATDRLQAFAQAVRRIFRSAGFITETRPLVLHATVANLRYAVQASGHRGGFGRGAKGKRAGGDGEGAVNAGDVVALFDTCGGDVEKFVARGQDRTEPQDDRVVEPTGMQSSFVWARDVAVDRVAICKLGATKSEDPIWGLEYPPIGFKMILDQEVQNN